MWRKACSLFRRAANPRCICTNTTGTFAPIVTDTTTRAASQSTRPKFSQRFEVRISVPVSFLRVGSWRNLANATGSNPVFFEFESRRSYKCEHGPIWSGAGLPSLEVRVQIPLLAQEVSVRGGRKPATRTKFSLLLGLWPNWHRRRI